MTGIPPDSLIDPESAEKIGTVIAVATGEVYRRDWQRWAAAVGDHNPLWFDSDYAQQHGYRDIICPPVPGGHCAEPTTGGIVRCDHIPVSNVVCTAQVMMAIVRECSFSGHRAARAPRAPRCSA